MAASPNAPPGAVRFANVRKGGVPSPLLGDWKRRRQAQRLRRPLMWRRRRPAEEQRKTRRGSNDKLRSRTLPGNADERLVAWDNQYDRGASAEFRSK